MKSLNRPMFKRGGNVSARNNGIVSGFSNGGSAIDDLRAAGLIRDIERPQGLSTSDYLRIAAAGAQIMGAQPTGRSGFIGALQAASPALAGLGTDLATSAAARQTDFQNQLAAQDALLAQGVLADREADLQRELAALDKDTFEKILDTIDIAEKIILDPNSTEEEKQSARNDIAFAAAKYTSPIVSKLDSLELLRFQEDAEKKAANEGLEPGTAAYDQRVSELYNARKTKEGFTAIGADLGYLGMAEGGRVGMDKGGRTMMAMSDPSPEAERSDMLEDMALKRFGKPLSSLTDVQVIELEEDLQELIREKMSEGGSTRAGDNEEKAAEDRMKMESDKFYIDKDGNLRKIPTKKPRQNTRPGMNEEIAADAARRRELNPQGRAEGGAMTTGPKDSPLTFEELRARLPREVTDQVVRLLATSEAALLDFANIDTEQDIAIFNQKYNADLQLPTQVA
jgi:hypothetical protein